MNSFIDKTNEQRIYLSIDGWRAQTLYPLTEDELRDAMKHPNGFIGNKYGVDLYLVKLIK